MRSSSLGALGGIAGLLVGAAALLWALRGSDVGAIGAALARAGLATVAAGTAAHVVVQAIYAARWRLLMGRPAAMGLQRTFGFVGLGYLANYVLPARPGELVRAGLARALGAVPLAAALASLFLEKILDGATILGSVAIEALVVELPPEVVTAARLGGVVLAIGLAALVVAALARPAFLPAGLRSRLEEIGGPLRTVGPGVIALGLCSWAAIVLHQGVLCFGTGAGVGPEAWLMLYAALGLASLVPGAPGYLGTYQLAAIGALGAYGVERETAFAVATLYQLTRLLGSFVVACWAFAREGPEAMRLVAQLARVRGRARVF